MVIKYVLIDCCRPPCLLECRLRTTASIRRQTWDPAAITDLPCTATSTTLSHRLMQRREPTPGSDHRRHRFTSFRPSPGTHTATRLTNRLPSYQAREELWALATRLGFKMYYRPRIHRPVSTLEDRAHHISGVPLLVILVRLGTRLHRRPCRPHFSMEPYQPGQALFHRWDFFLQFNNWLFCHSERHQKRFDGWS